MTTSIDTNVLVSLRSKDRGESELASAALAKASLAGQICLCGAVFAELLGFPGQDSYQLRELLRALEIAIDWKSEQADWELAGKAYQGYVRRRIADSKGLPRRIATDFIIGAHAATRNYTLLTNDKGHYRAAFPNLRIATY